jgi:hypothetical protein
VNTIIFQTLQTLTVVSLPDDAVAREQPSPKPKSAENRANGLYREASRLAHESGTPRQRWRFGQT